MRPVDRGPVPQDANGQDKTVPTYGHWRTDLLHRLGNYCSYCEMPLHDAPQVEHVSPKSSNPAGLLLWGNLLLACGACNSRKSTKPCDAATHYLPDAHNTLLAFRAQVIPTTHYAEKWASIIVPATGLDTNQQKKAAKTIKLCRLDNLNLLPVRNQPKLTDPRWKYRWEAGEVVDRVRAAWDRTPQSSQPDFLLTLVELARAKGFFSLWYAAFADVPPVKAALLHAFPGTALACFDAAAGYAPTVRVAGDL